MFPFTQEGRHCVQHLETQIESDQGIDLASRKISFPQLLRLLPMAYRLSTDARTDFCTTKQMPRMRCRMRNWQVCSI